MKKKLAILCTLLSFTVICYSQTKIKDGTIVSTPTPNSNAVLELESNNKGLLPPRISLTSTATATPLAAHVSGMIIYNTATVGDVSPGYYYNDGSKWLKLAIANGSVSTAIRSISANTTLTDSDYKILVRATTSVSIDLPDPTTCKGRIYIVQNLANDQVTFNYPIEIGYMPSIPGTIIPAGSGLLLSFFADPYYITGALITLQSDGTVWTGYIQ